MEVTKEYNTHEYNIMCNLDRLKKLIENTTKDGKYTKVQEYQKYYDEVRTRPKIKALIKGTVHEIPTEPEDSSRINTSTQ